MGEGTHRSSLAVVARVCFRWAVVGLAALAGACARPDSVQPRAALPGVTVVQPVADTRAAARGNQTTGPAVRSHVIGTIARRALGPVSSRNESGGVAAWIVSSDRGSGQDLVVAPFGIDGALVGEPRVALSLPEEATSLVVRAAGGSSDGWLVAFATLLDRGEALSVLALNSEGTARATPVDVQRTSDHVRWVDLVSTPRGPVCVWAEESASGNANILAAPLDLGGKPRGVPVRVAQDVMSWAVTPAGDGVALAVVDGHGAGQPEGAGPLSWLRLDAEGRVVGERVTLVSSPSVGSDFEVAALLGSDDHESRAAGPWVLAWTDGTGDDSRVTLVTLERDGVVRGPYRVPDVVGGSRLVGLASGGSGIALAWDDSHSANHGPRALHLARVTVDGLSNLGAAPSLEVAARAHVEFVGTRDGFALLAPSVPCAIGDAGRDAKAFPQSRPPPEVAPAPAGTCPGPTLPTFIRLDGNLASSQVEPLFVGSAQEPATLAWRLECVGDRCGVLAATNASPTPIFSVDLVRRPSLYRAPVAPTLPTGAARATQVGTLATGQSFVEVAATRLGGETFVATLTNGTGSGRRRGSHGAGGSIVSLRRIVGDAPPVGPTILSNRAVAVGGVALDAAKTPTDGAIVAWVARDGSHAQVHVAHIVGHGHLPEDVKLTHGRGTASDVAVAWTGDGWLVAWVDTRDGNGEVYATKLDRNLKRVARDERITHAPGDASDVVLLVAGKMAWIAWSDPRESPDDGRGDVYVTTLRLDDARPASKETRVLETAANSRSPRLAPVKDGALVVWVEDAPSGVDAPGAVLAVRVSDDGIVLGAPNKLTLAAEGTPETVALEQAPTGNVRVAVARSPRVADETEAIDGLTVSSYGSQLGAASPIVDLRGPGFVRGVVRPRRRGLVLSGRRRRGARIRPRRAPPATSRRELAAIGC